jgi:hypothetical protein
MGKLERFAKEHKIEQETPDPRSRFDKLLNAMASGRKPKDAKDGN